MENQQLARKLKRRHVQMIALGGAIGTGLFLGCLLYTSDAADEL